MQIGVVTRVTSLGLFVELATQPGVEYGPAQVMEPIALDFQSQPATTTVAAYQAVNAPHEHRVLLEPKVGMRVLVESINGVPEDLVVLGRMPS